MFRSGDMLARIDLSFSIFSPDAELASTARPSRNGIIYLIGTRYPWFSLWNFTRVIHLLKSCDHPRPAKSYRDAFVTDR